MKKRMMSLLMALTMSLTLLPTTSYAAEESDTAIGAGRLCEHTQDCYPVSDSSAASGVMASDAGNGEAAEPAACSHVCSVESGCIKQEMDCKHEHDDECGYAPAVEGQSCTYACDLCGMIEITAWSWVDTQDVLDPESGVLALSASAESPVSYEDIVDLLPAEIEATTEDGTETLSLDSWSCDDYPAEGAYTGSYVFNAVLPDGYGLAADAPALTVTVELDDEVMLMAGQHSHCICGASHKDIGEHTGETQLTFDKKLSSNNSCKLEIDNEQAELKNIDGRKYCVLPAGSYYLAGDITLDKSILIESGEVNICLNGHTLYLNHGTVQIWEVIQLNGGTLNLTDCQDKGTVCHVDGNPGRGVTVGDGTSFTLYGGTICNNVARVSSSTTAQGGGVYIGDKSTFNMYGGKIHNNRAKVPEAETVSGYGGGVYCAPNGTFNLLAGEITENQVRVESNNGGYGFGGGVFNNGTFTMSGNSKISNNSITSSSSAEQYGGGVCNRFNTGSVATFVMNGGEISGNHIDSWYGGSAYGGGVYNSKTFKFTGGTITDNKVQSNEKSVYGGGVYNDSGVFTMSSGTISKNMTITDGVSKGGGVCIYHSAFTMSGGEISGNQALTYTASASPNSCDGGGIYFESYGSKFELSGGTITGNTAKGKGAGICINDDRETSQKYFHLSGNPYIWDNKTDNKQCNLYMYQRYDLKSPLTQGAKVGLSLLWYTNNNVMVYVDSGITDDMSKYFASDDSAYKLERSGNTIIRTSSHANVFSADENNHKITASCLSHSDENRGSLAISAPEVPDGQEKITYDGKTKEAKITNTISDVTPKVTYTYKAVGATESTTLSEGEKPTKAGTYTASVSLKGADDKTATVSVSYQIDKAAPTLTWADPATEKTITYTGQEITTNDLPSVTVGLQNGETYKGKIQYSYRKISDGSTSGRGDFSADIPKEVGVYEVKASIAADGNYTAAETSNTRTIIITKATPVIAENPTASVIIYGQTLSDSTLTGGKATYKTVDGTEVTGTFAWKNGNIKPAVADSGTTAYDVTFIPSDTHNYNVVDTKLTLTVNKAAKVPNMPGTTMAPAHSTNKVGDITLPEGWSWQEADRDTELADGKAVTATAVYTGADKGNYEKESVIITITRSTCDHTHTEIRNQQEATCKKEGYTGDTYCKDCGEKLATGTATVKKAHTVGTPATCVSKAVCSVCSETFGEVDATNHVHTTVKKRKEATCTQTGYTGDTYCTDCNKLLETSKELAALGHDYKATVTKQPTTTEEGVRTYTCTRCNSSYTESIAKLPKEQHTHNYAGSVTKEATCTEAGVRTYTCSCGDSYTESIPATGHSYVSKITKSATTTEEGIMTYTCSKCGHSYTHPIAKIKADDSSRDNGNQNPKPQSGTNNGNQNRKPQSDTDNGKEKGASIKPYIKDDSGKEGWDVISSQLDEAKSGETVTVAMNGTTVVPKDIFDSIKGEDVTLVLDMGNGLSWKINGQDITEPSGDIDFGVTAGADAGKSIPVDVINSVTGERYSMNLSLAYDGEFGFTATLIINMEPKNSGMYANLFYYNEQTGELEFVSAGQIDSDGNAELVFTHASDYTIVIDAAVMNDENKDSINTTDGSENSVDGTTVPTSNEDNTKDHAWNLTIVIIIGICILLIVFGAVIFVRKKRGLR